MRKDFATAATGIGWLGYPALAGSTEMGSAPLPAVFLSRASQDWAGSTVRAWLQGRVHQQCA